MATNLDLDDELISAVVQVGGHKTKKAAVTAALEEYVRRFRQRKILELGDLVAASRAVLIGPVRQELLSGLNRTQFEIVRQHLSGFEDVPLGTDDFVEAARCRNTCGEFGVQGSPVDFLICAAAMRRSWPIFATDADFRRYAKHRPLRLRRVS